MMYANLMAVAVGLLGQLICFTDAYFLVNRRGWISDLSLVCQTTSLVSLAPGGSSSSSSSSSSVVLELKEANTALSKLLENWDRATIECNYADVPRELLESRNKELLLEKATTSALFDKSVSVESCKTSNKIVRDYLGVTGRGPLVGIEKKIRKALDLVDPDNMDDFLVQVEQFSQDMSKAVSLSYTAGTADFNSINNFMEGSVSDTGSNLDQSRQAIQDAKTSLGLILAFIDAPGL